MWDRLFPTTVVGSITRPWFFRERVDRYLEERAAGREVSDEELLELMDRSIPYVAALQEAAGVDVISDGEWRRKSYLGIIADMVAGFELHKAFVDDGVHDGYVGYTITGPIEPFDEGLFAREGTRLMEHTSRPVRVAIPTPYHVAQVHWQEERSADAYPDRREVAEALVPVIRNEVQLMARAGIRFVGFDDTSIGSPYAEDPDSEEYREDLAYAVDSFNRVVEGIDGIHTSLHLCGKRNLGPERRLGYDALLPALQEMNVDMAMFELRDMDDYDRELLRRLPKRMQVGCGCLTAKQHGAETPEEVAGHVRKVLEVVEPERVVLHPDCGFSPGTYWNISIDDVYDKLRSEVLAAEMLRAEVGG